MGHIEYPNEVEFRHEPNGYDAMWPLLYFAFRRLWWQQQFGIRIVHLDYVLGLGIRIRDGNIFFSFLEVYYLSYF